MGAFVDAGIVCPVLLLSPSSFLLFLALITPSALFFDLAFMFTTIQMRLLHSHPPADLSGLKENFPALIPECFHDLMAADGGCLIPDTAKRGMTLPQLRLIDRHLKRRLEDGKVFPQSMPLASCPNLCALHL